MDPPLHPSGHLARACHWTDGGGEFVFSDGTILSFRNDMETFVAVSATPGAASAGPDMLLTSLCLSRYRAKVTQALDLFNRFTPNPRNIDGLSSKPAEVWNSSAPIDTMVLSEDPSLFSHNAGDGRSTLTCAMRTVTMTLDGNGATFHVRWPSPVYDVQGSAQMFMSPMGPQGQVPKYLCDSSFRVGMKAIRYCWLEQTFNTIEVPREWRAMLELLQRHLQQQQLADGSFEADTSPQQHALTPFTLPEGRRPATSQFGLRSPVTRTLGVSASSGDGSIKFSPIQPDDARAFLATTAMHNAAPHLHNARATVMWRYDADPTGRRPQYLSWGLSDGRSCAFVYEDASTAIVSPLGEAYVLSHTRSDGQMREYHQSPDGSIALPRFVNASSAASKEAALSLGRYLPDIGPMLISMSQRNMQSAFRSGERQQHTSDVVARQAGGGTEVVKCCTRIEHVGTFTALTNGVVRGHFDDRTIVTLLPDAHDSEEGLACTMIGRDATTSTVRAIHVSTGHPMAPYLTYLLPFRRFQRLGENEQKLLGREEPAGGYTSRIDPMSLQRREADEMEAVMYRTKQAIDRSLDTSSKCRALLST